MRKSWKNISFLRSKAGLAAVEFAVVAPIMLVVLFAVSDLAGLILQRLKISQVLQEAVVWPISEDAITDIRTFFDEKSNDITYTIADPVECTINCVEGGMCTTAQPCTFVEIKASGAYEYKFPLSRQLFGDRAVYSETISVQIE
jgi:Flp pilus assembly protein TadG